MAKKLAVFAFASAFALAASLPVIAASREDKEIKKPRRVPATAQRSVAGQPQVKVFGDGDPGQLRFRRFAGPQTPSFFQKAECTFSCGDWEVTCSGSSASCSDEEGCTASGGGVTLEVECVN